MLSATSDIFILYFLFFFSEMILRDIYFIGTINNNDMEYGYIIYHLDHDRI